MKILPAIIMVSSHVTYTHLDIKYKSQWLTSSQRRCRYLFVCESQPPSKIIKNPLIILQIANVQRPNVSYYIQDTDVFESVSNTNKQKQHTQTQLYAH